jgi:hypothetical protein
MCCSLTRIPSYQRKSGVLPRDDAEAQVTHVIATAGRNGDERRRRVNGDQAHQRDRRRGPAAVDPRRCLGESFVMCVSHLDTPGRLSRAGQSEDFHPPFGAAMLSW